MTPRQLARQAHAALEQAGNPNVAASQRRFFKPWEKVALYGIATPDLRRVEREMYQIVRKSWHYADAVAFSDILIRDRRVEAKALGLMTLARYTRHFETGLAGRAKRWLAADLCDNWAVTDQLSTQILSPLLVAFPPLESEFAAWTESRNLWVRRAGVVAFVKLAGKGVPLDTVYQIVRSLSGDQHDLMHKACGWLLREAGKADARRLERFLLADGQTLSRMTVRYAIERFAEPKRRRILERTRYTG